jgi:hypothetical protein
MSAMAQANIQGLLSDHVDDGTDGFPECPLLGRKADMTIATQNVCL